MKDLEITEWSFGKAIGCHRSRYLVFPDKPFATLRELTPSRISSEAPQVFGTGIWCSPTHSVIEPLLHLPAFICSLHPNFNLHVIQFLSCLCFLVYNWSGRRKNTKSWSYVCVFSVCVCESVTHPKTKQHDNRASSS